MSDDDIYRLIDDCAKLRERVLRSSYRDTQAYSQWIEKRRAIVRLCRHDSDKPGRTARPQTPAP